MTMRVRFAPSPTGHVHIGNLRVAVFNWLLARHEGGKFLLRVEDTDRERSTPEAIATLLDALAWLGLDFDEEPLYQTSQVQRHQAAAERLLAEGRAYRAAKGGTDEATLFRIPYDCSTVSGVVETGAAEVVVHPDVPVEIDASGLRCALVSKKGKPMPHTACLAGYLDLVVEDEGGSRLLALADEIDAVLSGARRFTLERAARLRFVRRHIRFGDLVKGDLAKPLDSMRDFVIVRSDGTPLFALANVCDDITQGITHIARGDDHVENTYRHLFLFGALGAPPPLYAHFPMIINTQGKPYSKRDGDAFVGDFKANGYLPEALFNYLTLLGWSPGDDREKLSRSELVALFGLDRVQSAPARMDLRKLQHLNGLYMAELPFPRFLADCRDAAVQQGWGVEADPARFEAVARLMHSRTRLFADVQAWRHFFVDLPEYDEEACRKYLGGKGMRAVLRGLAEAFAQIDFEDDAIEAAMHAAAARAGLAAGRLNQPVRVAVTGMTVGAGIYETLAVLGRERTLARLQHALATCCLAE